MHIKTYTTEYIRIDKFRSFKQKIMLYAKQINTRAKYFTLVDNQMCCTIIFISKYPQNASKILHTSISINI